SRYESNKIAGVSHFIEHLLFRGTEKRPTAKEISEAIEGMGGIINGGTDKETTVYWCKVARHHFPLALDVLVDMILHPRLAFEDIEKERQVIIEEIKMSYDSPQQRVGLLVEELLWHNHPLGRDIAGSEESVSAISRRAMLSYLKRHYLPGEMVVSIAGGLEHKESVEAADRALGDWLGGVKPPVYKPYKERIIRGLRIERRDIEQAHICLALPGLSLFDPQRFVLDLLNIVLGEGMSSRLFCEVRDRLGLAYSIGSFVEHLADTGSVTVYAGIKPKNLPMALRVILEQLRRFREEAVPDLELSKAKEFVKGRMLLRMEDSRNVAGWIGGQEVLTRQILDIDQVIAIVDAITADEIMGLARELLLADRLRLAVVGPIDEDESLAELLEI
ncbi:MAG TPA: insulinase family protein, partial [Dehalococcoidia bacterium]|nr:insulinase family protein [Dehalococcoidia bacterium]